MTYRFQRATRLLRHDPKAFLTRVMHEFSLRKEIVLQPIRVGLSSPSQINRVFGCGTTTDLHQAIARQSFPILSETGDGHDLKFDELELQVVLERADAARNLQVDLLGSGPIDLGWPIAWDLDYKSGYSWKPSWTRTWNINDLDRSSDVKFPWELSRMQWLSPIAQSYLLVQARDEDARLVRDIISDWIDANPVGRSINWACTMDVAIRAVTWCWLFHVFKSSDSWSEESFSQSFFKSMYLHANFIEHHLEVSDINGNHLLSNAAGLVFLGLFFPHSAASTRWADLGYEILEREILLQVFPDGVDHEGSIPYHRLAQELFLYPAMFGDLRGRPFSPGYLNRLAKMAEFTSAYSRNDFSCPVIGDADDGRLIALGRQPINDHTYLLPLSANLTHKSQAAPVSFSSSLEVKMFLQHNHFDSAATFEPESGLTAFTDGGFFIIRDQEDHVTVDCGPVGLQGRGGHGHNDALSFEASLGGDLLIVDSGSHVYTADWQSRNRFRSTASHNTPMVGSHEINRFCHPRLMWCLEDDARAEVLSADTEDGVAVVDMQHHGYERLDPPVTVFRRIAYSFDNGTLETHDRLQSAGFMDAKVPFHFAPAVELLLMDMEGARVVVGHTKAQFEIRWNASSPCTVQVQPSQYAPSYGRLLANQKLVFGLSGLDLELTVTISQSTSS